MVPLKGFEPSISWVITPDALAVEPQRYKKKWSEKELHLHLFNPKIKAHTNMLPDRGDSGQGIAPTNTDSLLKKF